MKPPLTGLDPYDEAWFRSWYKKWAQRTGITRNPDDPNSKYDFRKAWKERADPAWNDELKKWEWQPQYKLEEPMPVFNINININGVLQKPEEEEKEEEDDGVSAG